LTLFTSPGFAFGALINRITFVAISLFTLYTDSTREEINRPRKKMKERGKYEWKRVSLNIFNIYESDAKGLLKSLLKETLQDWRSTVCTNPIFAFVTAVY
jgi:hypothetical protein